MSLFSRRLNYVGTKLSYKKISTELRTPYRTVLAMRRGDIKPSPAQSSNMSKIYRREAYNASRASGVPVISSRKLSQYSPEHLKIKLAEVDLYVNDLASFHIGQKFALDPDTPIQELIDKHFIGIRDNILKSLRRSRRSIEDIEEHGLS